MVKSILADMRRIFKRLDKKHLAAFVPLTVLAYAFGGVTPMFLLSVVVGVGYIAWQISEGAK